MFRINKKALIAIGLVAALAVIILADRLLKKAEPTAVPGINMEKQQLDQTQTQNSQEGIKKPYSGSVNPKASPYSGRPLGEVRFGQGFNAPKELIDKRRGDLKVLAAVLTSNPKGNGGVDDWIAVGIIKKFFNDYEGTKDAWEYAGVLYPANALSFANLGSLYGFYLKDPVKAEFNYRKAIQNDPYQSSYYLGLADFYAQVDTAQKNKIPDVMLAGLQYVKDPNLLLYLAGYYKNIGDKANAVKYYQEVLKIAPDQAGIQEEIDKLSN